MKSISAIMAALLFPVAVFAQEKVTTFGLQVKPIIPMNLIGTGLEQRSGQLNLYSIDQKAGFGFGGVIRRGFTRWLSLETGINYTRRNYEASVLNRASNFADTSRFGIIGYEIPVTGLVFVQLSDQWFMDAAFGLALDFFPSDAGSFGDKASFGQESIRSSWSKNSEVMPWINTGLITNIGFEYRTKTSGYFYVGGSYHRPFRRTFDSVFKYDHNGVAEDGLVPLLGSYFSLDFKYFFYEPKEE